MISVVVLAIMRALLRMDIAWESGKSFQLEKFADQGV